MQAIYLVSTLRTCTEIMVYNTSDNSWPQPIDTKKLLTDSYENRESPLFIGAADYASTRETEDIDEDLAENEEVVLETEAYYQPSLLPRRLIWALCLGIMVLIVLHLFFLQRTSVMRDFRRWHGLQLTYTDVKRSYLVNTGVGNKRRDKALRQSILQQIGNLSASHRQTVVADPDVSKYVATTMRKMSFLVEENTGDVAMDIPSYSHLSVSFEGEVLYETNLTEHHDYDATAFYVLRLLGKAKARFIWVNHGTKRDLDQLLVMGHELDGAIFLCENYDTSSTILSDKLLLAKKYGAAGFVSYLAPNGDDHYQLAVWRDSAFLEETGVSPDIIAIPASYKAIKPLLELLMPLGIPEWRYTPEPQRNYVLEIESNSQVQEKQGGKSGYTQFKNIVATLPGVLRDGMVVLGAPRDSLTRADPLSGHAIMLEVMKQYQSLVAMGWKPLRTFKFVSWDALAISLAGAHSLLKSLARNGLFRSNHLVAYIDLAANIITGNKFDVKLSPLLVELVREASEFIPIPNLGYSRESTDTKDYTKLFVDEDHCTLRHVWESQSHESANEVVGSWWGPNACVIGNLLTAPIVELGWTDNAKGFVPNSELYGADWMMKDVDPDATLHGLLVRLVGLLGITFGERETIGYGVEHYMKFLYQELGQWKLTLSEFPEVHVDPSVYSGKQIESWVTEKATLNDLADKLLYLAKSVICCGRALDKKQEDVLAGIRKDYPWYKFHKKLVLYAKFKTINRELLDIENSLTIGPADWDYLGLEEKYFNHIVAGYGLTSFPYLHEATLDANHELMARWIVLIFEKLSEYQQV